MKSSKGTTSYSASHAIKAKSKVEEKGGKMTKFKNLDDIPDASPNYDWNTSSQNEYENKGQADHSFDNYTIRSTNIASPINIRQTHNAAEVRQGTTKAPPLPYDQIRAVVSKPDVVINNNAPPPNCKYFDYDEGGDDFEADEVLPTPSPKKGQRYESREVYTKGSAAMPAPPLPCDVSPTASQQQQQGDSIYFSKKPRPVQFKPYSLKQYKMIKPQEYVEISNIKPDLNSEELVAKRANLDRVKEFSKNLQSYNRQAISQQPKLPSAAEKHDIRVSEQKFSSNRQKAIEFAKNVPKPKVASYPVKRAGRDGERERYSDEPSMHAALGDMSLGADFQAESKIMELEAQHNNRRIQIEAIKRTMGMK